jgi:hypothetical protein
MSGMTPSTSAQGSQPRHPALSVSATDQQARNRTAATAPSLRRNGPCGHYRPAGLCGARPTRLYMVGNRCADHTPAALAGKPEPGADRYCPPALCWCGTCLPRSPNPAPGAAAGADRGDGRAPDAPQLRLITGAARAS